MQRRGLRRFADELAAADLPPLRGLVCNAGLQLTHRAHTEDGFEATFGINHLGHVALVEALVEAFRVPARIVFVASGTHDPAQRTGVPAPLSASARELAYPPPAGSESPARDGRRRYSTSSWPTGSSVASYDATANRELYEQSLQLIGVGAARTAQQGLILH